MIYAMWRIEPDAKLVVSIKQNPGQHMHAQCGTHGYVNFKSQVGIALPPIRPGEFHTLRAELRGRALTVTADGQVAWRGSFRGQRALPVGPPGFRTDNARFTLEYFATVPPQPRPSAQPGRTSVGQCIVTEGD